MTHVLDTLRLIRNTCQEYIAISAQPADNLKIWESNFGGLPYLPKGYTYPCKSTGEPLHLLAQLNFIDMPYLETFPREGILQFYIGDDEYYGLNFENPTDQDGFKILYIPHKGHYDDAQDLSFLQKPAHFPVAHPHRLRFMTRQMPITLSDRGFDKHFESIFKDMETRYEFIDIYSELLERFYNGHQVGGYPSFCQGDPRPVKKEKYKKLLFQLGSGQYIGWGDAGIANFFIDEENLKALDFSDILYNWDCS